MGSIGGIWVNFEKSLVEGILFQVSHYSAGVQITDFLAGALYQKDIRGVDRFYKLWKPVLRSQPPEPSRAMVYVHWRRRKHGPGSLSTPDLRPPDPQKAE